MKPRLLPASSTGQCRACCGSSGRDDSRRGGRPTPGRRRFEKIRTSIYTILSRRRLKIASCVAIEAARGRRQRSWVDQETMGTTTDTGAAHEPSLLGTLEHISRLVVSHTGDPSETLTNIARAIQQQFKSDVCSVYLLDADRRHLELAATIGLHPSSVGRVRMR